MKLGRALLAAACALGVAATPAAAAPKPRIVGGTTATDAYPAQAQVNWSDGVYVYLCGGTLVAPQWVLTAGHCVSDEDTGAQVQAASMRVELGSPAIDEGDPYTVDQIVRAPGFNSDTLAYDAALLHLTAPATQAPLSLIATEQAAAAGVGQLARVIGWGLTTADGDTADTLQSVDVPIVSDSTCRGTYGTSLIGATMVCAGYPEGGHDACQGDSGGPLLVDADAGAAVSWVVAGIVSWGGTCAAPEQYGVYTDMLNTTLRSWFATTVGTPGPAAPPVTPTPVAVSTPVATPTTAAPVVTPPPAANPVAPQPRKIPLRLAHRCSAKACSFKVSFAGDGYVTAQLYLPLRVAERLGFAGSRIATATRAASGTQNLRLALPRILRHRLTHAVRARLRVVATTADGGHSTATKAVILRP